jgi:serine/threonine protein kinase
MIYYLAIFFKNKLIIYIQPLCTFTEISCGLDWQTRYGIFKGICEGLKHLHEGLKNPIIHTNLKLRNILLDENMIPKIGDFGIPRFLNEEKGRSTDDLHPQGLTTNK